MVSTDMLRPYNFTRLTLCAMHAFLYLSQALTPVVEGIIGNDMQRFKDYAQEYAKAAAAARAMPEA